MGRYAAETSEDRAAELDLDAAAQGARRAPGVDRPLVSVAADPGAQQEERRHLAPGGEVAPPLGAKLLEDAQAVELVGVLLRDLVRRRR